MKVNSNHRLLAYPPPSPHTHPLIPWAHTSSRVGRKSVSYLFLYCLAWLTDWLSSTSTSSSNESVRVLCFGAVERVNLDAKMCLRARPSPPPPPPHTHHHCHHHQRIQCAPRLWHWNAETISFHKTMESSLQQRGVRRGVSVNVQVSGWRERRAAETRTEGDVLTRGLRLPSHSPPLQSLAKHGGNCKRK